MKTIVRLERMFAELETEARRQFHSRAIRSENNLADVLLKAHDLFDTWSRQIPNGHGDGK